MQTILWGMFGTLIAIVWTLNEIRDALRDIAQELAKAHLH